MYNHLFHDRYYQKINRHGKSAIYSVFSLILEDFYNHFISKQF